MQRVIDSSDPQWLKLRERRWNTFNFFEIYDKRSIENIKQLYMGEVDSPFDVKRTRDGKSWAYDLLYSPHQSVENWREWIAILSKRLRKDSNKEELADVLQGEICWRDLESVYHWDPQAEWEVFNEVYPIGQGASLLEQLAKLPLCREEIIFQKTCWKFMSLFGGGGDYRGPFDMWYEVFKESAWKMEHSILLPEAGAKDNRNKVSRSSAEDPKYYPSSIDRWSIKSSTAMMLSYMWHFKEVHREKRTKSQLHYCYDDIRVEEMDAFLPIDTWRDRIVKDLELGELPDSLRQLSEWLKLDRSSELVMDEITCGKRPYMEASASVGLKDREHAAFVEGVDQRIENELDELYKQYDGSDLLKDLEQVRLDAVEVKFIKESAPWHEKLENFTQWLSQYDDDPFTFPSSVEQKLTMLRQAKNSGSPMYQKRLLTSVFEGFCFGSLIIDRAYEGDPRPNIVYKYFWNYVAEQLSTRSHRVSCHSKFLKENGVANRCKITLITKKNSHQFFYELMDDPGQILTDIKSTIDKLQEDEEFKYRFFVYENTDSDVDVGEFEALYLPKAFTKYFD